ncbi:MAG: hypothetical protein VX641_05725 [Planctomycetota bacterium]|nr:hypothetical protein [Planctomycetota bacterium]
MMTILRSPRTLPLVTACSLLLAGGCSGERDAPSQSGASAGPPASEPIAPEVEWRTAASADERYYVRWRPLAEPIPLADPFDVEVEVWTDESMTEAGRFDRIIVDAGMPHHRHGMNIVPEISAEGPARFIARGMLFHMPGRWQLYVDLIEDGRLERSQWSMWLSG